MSTQTTNYNLKKPSKDEKYDIDVHNGNMDVIDSKLSELNEWKGARQFIITATNGNTYGAYPRGVTYSTINSSNVAQSGQTNDTKFPLMGTVQTVNYDRGRFYQLLHRNDNDGLYYRSFYCGTWQPWRKLMSKDSPEATHMHNITATNGNTYNAYPKGMSYSLITGGAKTQQGQDDNSEFPIYGTVTTINHSIYRFYQIIRNWSGQGLYERCYEARNGWWPWRRLDSGNVYKTASFTLDMSCMNCFVRCNSAAGMTVTVPTDASVPFPMATDITILREGNGDVSIAPASGVGIHSVDYMRKIDGRFAAVTLRKFGKDAWFLVGQLTS